MRRLVEPLAAFAPGGETDAGADLDRKAVDMDRACHGLDQHLREPALVAFRQADGGDEKFIAAEAEDAVRLAQRAKATRHLDQKRVATLVAHEVVDLLEAVEVDGKHRDRSFLVFAGRPAKRQGGALEGVAVGQLGQVVVRGGPVGAGLGGGAQLHFLAQVVDAQDGIDEAHGAADGDRQHELVGAVWLEDVDEAEQAFMETELVTQPPQSRAQRNQGQKLLAGPAEKKIFHPGFLASRVYFISGKPKMFVSARCKMSIL